MFHNLFDVGEGICFGANVFETRVNQFYDDRFIQDAYQFFSINPLHLTRKDANVTAYRNILVEFDKGSLDEQRTIITNSGCPVTTVTFSGSKSLHMIISLAEPCKSRAAYDVLVERIYRKFPTCDTSARNPSRFSRTPQARRENGAVQVLEWEGSRVSTAALETFLGPAPAAVPKEPRAPTNKRRMLRGETMYFLSAGAESGAWNKALFLAALDMARSGFVAEEILSRLEEVTGRLDASDRRTINSALNAAEQN